MHKKAVIQYTVLVYCIIRIHCYWSKNCSVFPTPALILSRFFATRCSLYLVLLVLHVQGAAFPVCPRCEIFHPHVSSYS